MADDQDDPLIDRDNLSFAELCALDDVQRAETQRLLKKLERPAEPKPVRRSDTQLAQDMHRIARAQVDACAEGIHAVIDGLMQEIGATTGGLEKRIANLEHQLAVLLRGDVAGKADNVTPLRKGGNDVA
jgi:hypothetical protein